MGSSDTASPVATRAKGRKYGFACLSCRRKKVKCDGNKPACINCNKSKESCVYRDNPAFVGYLADELRKSKIRIQELESVIKELSILDSESRHSRLATLVGELEQRSSSPSPGSSAFLESDEPHVGLSVSYGGSVEYNIDENGRQQYFGATSRFHTLSEDNEHPAHALDTTTEREYTEIEYYHRKWHLSNSRWQATWEHQAHENIPKYTDVDASLCSRLLDVYWTWQGPLHQYVYRRCFFRDMAIGGPYFSLFLLNVMFAHAMRHMPEDDPRFKPFDKGDFFMKRAMLLLLDEIKESKPKIPTIQGLLILGGRQCAVGLSSEGWLYTGMAIRMITDLGLHLRKGKGAMKEYEPDDLELTHAMMKINGNLLKYVKPKNPFHLPSVIIINECYNTVYNGHSGTPQSIKPEAIFDLERKLHNFHRTLPDCLRIEDASDLTVCIPPHIMSLNILYHTMLILIFRPFFIWRWNTHLHDHPLALRAQVVCTEQAADVNEIFRAYGRLFDFQYQTYLVSYCVYTAATIDVRLIHHDDRNLAEKAADRLVVTLRMLETELKQTPGIKRSIEIIRSHLGQQRLPVLNENVGDARETTSAHHHQQQQQSRGEKWQSHKISPSPSASASYTTIQQPQQKLPLPHHPHPHPHHPSRLHQTTEMYDHHNPFTNLQPESSETMTPLPLNTNTTNNINSTNNNIQEHTYIDAQMQRMDMSWVDWNVDDSSGGFAPDMAYWAAGAAGAGAGVQYNHM
ncbi:Transcription factor [Penicillium occitanis (nom. inval.)]|nr:Transcription factor [Penicillium occitanis (nom. inval.)]PCG96440.1 hypothetical protein PENOC_072730 [Penicillium occitanis (nom. inval.)]